MSQLTQAQVKNLINQHHTTRKLIEAHKTYGFIPKDGRSIQGPAGARGISGSKGERGEIGPRGFPGEKGRDGKNVSPEIVKLLIREVLKDMQASDFGAADEKSVKDFLDSYEKKSGKSLEARLNRLQDAVMRNYGGRGGGRTPFYYDLSSQLNGVTTTFSITNHSAIFAITSSSAPFTFRPTVDFTETSTTVTFTNQIDPPTMLASGTSILLLLVP